MNIGRDKVLKRGYTALAICVLLLAGCTGRVLYSPGSEVPHPTASAKSRSAEPTPTGPLNTSGLTMEDVAAVVGIFEVNISWSATPVDYNGDGQADVLIGYHANGAKLWRNDGEKFTRVNPAAWPAGPDRHYCTWGDANGDGRLDVYCTVGRLLANNVKVPPHPDNELWLQQADGSFIDVGTAWGIGDPYGRGRATTFIDANGDEFPDLFVGNELPRETDADHGVGGENKLFLNTRGQGFVVAPEFGLDALAGARCAHALDYDGDGWEDLFVCGSNENHLYRNDAGKRFLDVTSETGIISRAQLDADFGDLNGDGQPDVVFTSRTKVLYQLFEAGAFASPQPILTTDEGKSAALGDADGNGEIDVYVVEASTTSDAPDVLLLNSGLAFAAIKIPVSTGLGDSVEAIDSDRDGRVEFLVLNGSGETEGPVQLLRLVPNTNNSP